jgi:hypothetical protein
MRDFNHVMGLIEVSALFQLAQRPVLVRKLKVEAEGKEGFREEQQCFVMATRQDFDSTMALWKEVRETTETSAASHHLRFFHEVVEPVAAKKSLFTVNELTDAWNARFSDRKSSDAIRNYVDFLCQVGYMSKERDPSDKRQNLLKVIHEQNGKYTENELSVFFTLDSFKAWLNEAETITEENHISLKQNLFAEAETTPELIYKKYFIDESRNSSINVLSPSETPTVESRPEKTDNQKTVQFPDFQIHLNEVKSILALDPPEQGTCGKCQRRSVLRWTLQTFNENWVGLCQDCGVDLQNQKREESENSNVSS